MPAKSCEFSKSNLTAKATRIPDGLGESACLSHAGPFQLMHDMRRSVRVKGKGHRKRGLGGHARAAPDGGSGGPITAHWGISGFPSIFVLDKAGVIRFKDVRGDDLDQAVASLVDETSAETRPPE